MAWHLNELAPPGLQTGPLGILVSSPETVCQKPFSNSHPIESKTRTYSVRVASVELHLTHSGFSPGYINDGLVLEL